MSKSYARYRSVKSGQPRSPFLAYQLGVVVSTLNKGSQFQSGKRIQNSRFDTSNSFRIDIEGSAKYDAGNSSHSNYTLWFVTLRKFCNIQSVKSTRIEENKMEEHTNVIKSNGIQVAIVRNIQIHWLYIYIPTIDIKYSCTQWRT
jgi:hypothetical protein